MQELSVTGRLTADDVLNALVELVPLQSLDAFMVLRSGSSTCTTDRCVPTQARQQLLSELRHLPLYEQVRRHFAARMQRPSWALDSAGAGDARGQPPLCGGSDAQGAAGRLPAPESSAQQGCGTSDSSTVVCCGSGNGSDSAPEALLGPSVRGWEYLPEKVRDAVQRNSCQASAAFGNPFCFSTYALAPSAAVLSITGNNSQMTAVAAVSAVTKSCWR